MSYPGQLFPLQLGLGLEFGFAFQGVKMSTFEGPDYVQMWESDFKKCFWTKLGPRSVGEVDFFKIQG